MTWLLSIIWLYRDTQLWLPHNYQTKCCNSCFLMKLERNFFDTPWWVNKKISFIVIGLLTKQRMTHCATLYCTAAFTCCQSLPEFISTSLLGNTCATQICLDKAKSLHLTHTRIFLFLTTKVPVFTTTETQGTFQQLKVTLKHATQGTYQMKWVLFSFEQKVKICCTHTKRRKHVFCLKTDSELR